MERRHQPGPSLRESRPGQPTDWQTYSRKVPAVTTTTVSHHTTETQSSCLAVIRWSVKLLQGWVELLLPFYRRILPLRVYHPPDTTNIEKAFQKLREVLLFAFKRIPRGRRENYVPYWDKDFETLYRSSFLWAPVGTGPDRVASSLVSRLSQKRQEQSEEAVNSSEFSHSSRKAWSIINKLTGRYGHSFRLCPISANSIASQLVKNGAHKTVNRESTKLNNKQLSDLWKVPPHEGDNIPGSITPEVLTYPLKHLKLGKNSEFENFFPKFILHAGSALKPWLCDFHILHAPSQNLRDLEKSTDSCDP